MAQLNLTGTCSRPVANGDPLPECVFAEGTIIYTLEGALPVEYLLSGDRIITRVGMQTLIGIDTSAAGYSLRFAKPQIVYADGVETRAA